jgi:DNA-directed RNA polymerase specialized sigma24 family protein
METGEIELLAHQVASVCRREIQGGELDEMYGIALGEIWLTLQKLPAGKKPRKELLYAIARHAIYKDLYQAFKTDNNIEIEYNPVDEVQEQEQQERLVTDVKNLLNDLEPQERELLEYRFGLNGKKKMKWKDLAKHFHASRQGLQIKYNTLLRRLRNPLGQRYNK